MNNLVIINVYMPILDRSDLQNAISKYDETLGFIDFILNDNSDAQIVILGDFNCNMYNPAHPFSTSLNDFITFCNLVSTFSRMASFHVDSTFTRHDSRSKSLLDYVFVSRGIIDSVTNVSIGDYHDNHSDHLPVEMELSLHIPSLNDRNKNYSKNYNGIIWS